MNAKIRKWTPFFVIIVIILVTGTYFFFGNLSVYYPKTDNPAVIYREACMGCHGAKGEGNGFIYPKLAEENLSLAEVRKMVSHGSMFMPEFEYIKADTLQKLAEYVQGKKYLSGSPQKD